MGAHRDLAIAAMRARSAQSERSDFMARAGIPMPQVATEIGGSLPSMLRQEVPAEQMKLLVDLVMLFTIGDYVGSNDYSNYYDPESPWYNVLYGAYGLQSYKLDGDAWGYHADGTPDFEEFMKVPAIDYNFFTAGQFGCPPDRMCFDPKLSPGTQSISRLAERVPPFDGSLPASSVPASQDRGWDYVEVVTDVPSGLHDPASSLGRPETYVVYGIPNQRLLKDHEPYEPVPMKGQMFMRQIPPNRLPKGTRPITLAFGVLCPDTPKGEDLMELIIDKLWTKYRDVDERIDPSPPPA